MAALCPGVQYGLSSQENFGENKDLVFVKLTDSAYRAIEEYLRLQKQNKHLSRTPTIKFLGNEGQLCFPSSPGPNPSNSNGPATSPSTSTATFNFSLSSTTDMEGPGGSFECVQHRQLSTAGVRSSSGGTTLAGLGPISHKMRVHATDDVYEETRKRMTFAEKVHKNKCTREIKMNQTDIGRKVKVKQHHNQTQSSQSAAPSSGRSGNIGSGSGSSNSIIGSSNTNNNMRRNDSLNIPTGSMLSSSSTAAAITSSSSSSSSMTANLNANQHSPLKNSSPYSPSLNSNNKHNSGFYNNSGNNGLLDRISGGGGGGNMPTNGMQQRSNGQQGLRSNHVSSSRSSKQAMSSISKRSLRERLIHLLALRPFKKIEIHERLNKEGLRERNGNAISSALKLVATLKDNCYYLNRVLWNDVQEEWPFYTEQEKQMLKRRKPQNLTPPGGSDGGSSTGSGNSPTSTHPGSPPSTTTTISAGRHRVAHLSNQPQHNNISNCLPLLTNQQQQQQSSNAQQQSAGGGGGGGGGGYNNRQQLMDGGSSRGRQLPLPVDRRDASGMNPRSRQPQQQQQPQQQGYGWNYGGGMKRQLSDDEEDVMGLGDDRGSNRKRPCDSHTLSFGVHRDSSKLWTTTELSTNPQHNHRDTTSPSPTKPHQSQSNTFDLLRDTNNYNDPPPIQTPIRTTPTKPPQQQQQQQQPQQHQQRWQQQQQQTKNAAAPQPPPPPPQRKEVIRVSPDSQSDRIDSSILQQQRRAEPMRQQVVEMVEEEEDEEQLRVGRMGGIDEDDYVREYTTIGDLEQRRRYKSDFNAVYDEYKELHGVVESVSRRFQVLDERLKREPTANTPRYNEIKEQIMREYKLTKKDHRHQQAKRRFEYLHRKLSHIKGLVSQYDLHIQNHETTQPQDQTTTTTY